ncbi:MAG: hypothetical protein IJY23_00510 [Clostridia bacterium]|nr:hypothetical protein [Clostridia bacterium]
MKSFGNVLIIGDSYSTFKGFNPDGYAYWYPQCESKPPKTDVEKVSETWWHQLISETESNLILNESYSGSTVCSTERESIPGTHFNLRADRMISNGFFKKNRIDTIFIFGGTNDSWIDSPIGDIKYDQITEDDIKMILPAFSALISKLKAASPNSRIIPLINCDIKNAVADGFEEICRHYELTYIKFETIDKLFGHPNRKGMKQIKDAVKNIL